MVRLHLSSEELLPCLHLYSRGNICCCQRIGLMDVSHSHERWLNLVQSYSWGSWLNNSMKWFHRPKMHSLESRCLVAFIPLMGQENWLLSVSNVSSKDRRTLKNGNFQKNRMICWVRGCFSFFFWYVFSGFKIPAEIMLIPGSEMFALVLRASRTAVQL